MVELLAMALHVAVPTCIDDLNQLPDGARAVTQEAWLREGRELIPANGDAILYKAGRKERPTREGFVVLARAIAALSFAPGGVRVFGGLWCARHHPWGTDPGRYVCDQCADERRPVPAPDVVTVAGL